MSGWQSEIQCFQLTQCFCDRDRAQDKKGCSCPGLQGGMNSRSPLSENRGRMTEL